MLVNRIKLNVSGLEAQDETWVRLESAYQCVNKQAQDMARQLWRYTSKRQRVLRRWALKDKEVTRDDIIKADADLEAVSYQHALILEQLASIKAEADRRGLAIGPDAERARAARLALIAQYKAKLGLDRADD